MLPVADLHLHSYYSDGYLSPSDLIDKVAGLGIKIVSLTDHDSIDGILEAKERAKIYGIELISGIEISTDVEDKEVHLLGYFFDIFDANLNNYIKFFKAERMNRAKRIIEKLNYLGVNISIEQVLETAKYSSIGRPHIANTLVSLGAAKNYFDAFDKYLRDNGPAYVKKNHLSAASAIKLISDAGGLVILAHPCNISDSILTSLIKSGIDGIETIHPSHTNNHTNFFRGIVNSYFLFETGGSDYHGGYKNDDENLGKFVIPAKLVDTMRRLVNKHY